MLWPQHIFLEDDKSDLSLTRIADAGHDSEAEDATDTDTEDEVEDQEVRQVVDVQMAKELPPGCLDVTTALQFMVDNSSITFHQVRLTGL